MGEQNSYKNGQFGAAVGVGVAFADTLAASVPDMGLGITASGKGVSVRLTEVGLSTSSSYALSRWVFGNYGSEYHSFAGDLARRAALIAAADVASNVALDFIQAKPVSLFS
jgi:hypothetical protein